MSKIRQSANFETIVRRTWRSFFETENGAVTTEFVVVSATVATLALAASILALSASMSIYSGVLGPGSRTTADIKPTENAMEPCGGADGPGSASTFGGPTETGKSDGSGGKAAPRKLGRTGRVVLSAN
jgi:hypothetical protein